MNTGDAAHDGERKSAQSNSDTSLIDGVSLPAG